MILHIYSLSNTCNRESVAYPTLEFGFTCLHTKVSFTTLFSKACVSGRQLTYCTSPGLGLLFLSRVFGWVDSWEESDLASFTLCVLDELNYTLSRKSFTYIPKTLV